MKVNGTRVEDLAGTGLVTKQRYVLPLYVTVPLFLTKKTGQVSWWLLVRLVQWWTLTLPGLALIVVHAKAGWLGVLTAVMCIMAAGMVWGA